MTRIRPVAFTADTVADHLREYGGEVHADTVVLHLVLYLIAKADDIVYVEVVTIDGIVYGLCFYRRVDMLSLNLELSIVAAVDVALTSLAFSDVFVHHQLFHLHHRVWQQCVMPVGRVDQCHVDTEGTVHNTIVDLHRRQVGCTGTVFIKNVILYKPAQRVHRVFQILETVSRRIDILWINLVVDLTSLLVEGVDVTRCYAVFLL